MCKQKKTLNRGLNSLNGLRRISEGGVRKDWDADGVSVYECVCVCVHACLWMPLCVRVCMSVYTVVMFIFIRARVCVRANVCTFVHRNVCACLYVRAYVRALVCERQI